MSTLPSYKPSCYYYRKALREAKDQDRATVVGLIVIYELEQLKAWVREQGMIPPKWIVDDEEAREKGWVEEAPADAAVGFDDF